MILKQTSLLAAVLVAGASVTMQPAAADETGMAGMHSWRKVGNKTCMTDHTHYGNSSGHRSEKAALNAAIKDWQEFTAFEYGLDWAYFHRADARLKSCSKSGAGWGCSIEGRPCKRR